MTYDEIISKLKADPKVFGTRGNEWENKLNGRIMVDKGYVMQCTHDWPQSFRPSQEDLAATDWELTTGY